MSIEIDLSDHLAVVTGANGGIGSAVAETLLAAGARTVVGLDLSTESRRDEKGGYAYSDVDITDTRSVRACFARIASNFGTPTILVNCAGITLDGLIVNLKHPLQSMTVEQFRAVLDVNLIGTFNCLQVAAELMIDAESGGSIVNISSISSAGNMGQANYSASKAGVLALTVSAAAELGRAGIRVNAISPGPVNTNMLDTVPDGIRESYVKRTPLRREAEAADIADAVLYLTSNRSKHVTGENLVVSGGLRF